MLISTARSIVLIVLAGLFLLALAIRFRLDPYRRRGLPRYLALLQLLTLLAGLLMLSLMVLQPDIHAIPRAMRPDSLSPEMLYQQFAEAQEVLAETVETLHLFLFFFGIGLVSLVPPVFADLRRFVIDQEQDLETRRQVESWKVQQEPATGT